MVFGLFSKEKSLQRTIAKATNKLAQQPDRWSAMERLRDEGSEEALYGLCRRFSIVSHKSSEDEQEKSWAVDALVAKGEVAIGPVRRYLKNHAQLAFALQVLGRIVPKERALQVIDELFESEPPGYTRDPERRLDLIKWLGEWSGATADDVFPRLLPYLKDHSEDVRYFAAEALAHRDLPRVAPALLDALVNPEEEAGRFKRLLAEQLAAAKHPLGDRADAAKQVLLASPATSQFTVKDGRVVQL